MGRVTIKDVANDAGVSITTASFAINHRTGRISEAAKEKVLASAESEHWIMLTASHYDLRYTGVVNELLKTLEDAKDYQNLHKYAAQSLAVAPGNVKAHYWLIVAMFNLGADEMADTQLEAAKRALTDEEYYELVEALKKAKITEPSNLFRNEKLSI